MADWTDVRRKTCRPFHKWSKWSEPQEGRKKHDGKDIGSLIWQSRTCERCGKVQFNEIAS